MSVRQGQKNFRITANNIADCRLVIANCRLQLGNPSRGIFNRQSEIETLQSESVCHAAQLLVTIFLSIPEEYGGGFVSLACFFHVDAEHRPFL